MVDKIFYAAGHANVDKDFLEELMALQGELDALNMELNGNPAKNQIGEKNKPTIGDRLFALNRGVSLSTYGPTPTHQATVEIITKQLSALESKLDQSRAKAKDMAKRIKDAGGAWIEGMD